MAGAKVKQSGSKSGRARLIGTGARVGKVASAGNLGRAWSKFLLTYDGLDDPDPAIVEDVVRTFAPAKVVEVIPGTLKVEGNRAKIRRQARDLDSWSLSTEGLFSSTRPSRTRLSAIRG